MPLILFRYYRATMKIQSPAPSNRLNLLKIRALIQETCPRLWIPLSSAYPRLAALAGLLHHLRSSPA